MNTHASPALAQFLATVAQLRRECPWDREQTPQSLCPYILEESAELVEAIEAQTDQAVLEELGDVLLQVVLQAQIYSERGAFDFADVCEHINAKMIYRHPHVFPPANGTTVEVTSSAEVAQNWEQLKNQAKPPQTLTAQLRQLPKQLSALDTTHKISRKVAKVGFEWPHLQGVLAKVHEELAELETALAEESVERQAEELGDVLFSLVNIARWQGINSESALRETNRRFLKRFDFVEQLATRPLAEYSPVELEALWQQAKQRTYESNTLVK